MKKYVLRGLTGVTAVIGLIYSFAWFAPYQPPHEAWFDPRPGDHTPLVVAHQGAEGIRPANTMLGFRDARALGADVLDSDVHMTKDGVLVLIHDETVDRTTNGTGAVRDMTYEQIRQLDAGYRFSTDNGQTFPYRGQGLYVPTLDELFAEFGHVRYGLEIKQTVPEAGVKLCEFIRADGLQQDVLISSFSQNTMDAFREACPEVATSAAPKEGAVYYIYYRLGLAGLYHAKFGSLQISEYSAGVRILSPRFIEANHRKGIEIIPWTINEEADMHRIIDLGVEGINTDYPDRLIQILENR